MWHGAHLQKGHASNSASMSGCRGSSARSREAGPAVVPYGSREMEAKPLVAVSRNLLRGAAASPPAERASAHLRAALRRVGASQYHLALNNYHVSLTHVADKGSYHAESQGVGPTARQYRAHGTVRRGRPNVHK